MRNVLAGALALGALLPLAPAARAEAKLAVPATTVQVPADLVQPVQYYGYPGYGYYGRPRFYGRPRYFGPGPGYYGRRGFYGGPRYYGRGPGYYGRRGYYR